MQKLWFNGCHLRNIFSLHLSRTVFYSTSSVNAEDHSSLVNYLVKNLGFSRKEADQTWNKVSYTPREPSVKVQSVVDFLRGQSLDNAHIRKIVSSYPNLLCCNVVRTLKPKINALEKLGIVGCDLADILSANPSILRRGLETRVLPMIVYVKSILGSGEYFKKFLRRSYWLMSTDFATNLKPDVELLKNYGFSDEKIRKMLVTYYLIFSSSPKKLQGIFVRVEEELGIHRTSAVFADAVVLLTSFSETNLKSKHRVFKSFGWSDSDIHTMVRKSPRCLMLSVAALCSRLGFFMHELGCEPQDLAQRCYVLTYSLEARVVPRYTLLKILYEKNLIKATPGILQVVCTSEPQFLKMFALPYKEEVPDFYEAYICKKKGSLHCRPNLLLERRES